MEFIDARHDQRMNEPWMNLFALVFLHVSVPSYRSANRPALPFVRELIVVFENFYTIIAAVVDLFSVS